MEQSRRFLPSTAALAAFEAVARQASFTGAAEELALTQSAVSRQVRQLEAQMGRQLFNRTSRHVELTAEGRAYAETIGAALQAIRQASVQLATGGGSGVLRLAVLPTFATRWLMPRLPAFLAANPGITIDMVSRIGRFDLAAEGVDAAIQHGTPEWPGGQCIELIGERLVPVASPTFLAEHSITDAADLLKLPLLHLHSRPTAWEAWFRAEGIVMSHVKGMRLEHFSTTTQACIGGIGIGLMPRFLIESELASGELVIAGPEHMAEGRYFLVLPARGAVEPAHKLKSWLIEEVAACALCTAPASVGSRRR